MIETEFDEEAVKDMAQVIESFRNDGPETGSGVLRGIAKVANKHDIPKDKRVDFAVDGLKYYTRKKEVSIISDFRENLEDMEQMFT